MPQQEDPNNPIASACQGKVVYDSFSHAEKTVRRQRRQHQRKGLKPYWCRYCQKVHVAGHSRRRR